MADLTIHNLEELKSFRDRVNSGESFSGKTVVLAADINLNNEEWTPIGNSTNQFQGNFDGQGHTVSNLKIDGTGKSNQGFFGFTTNGSVSNLTIENATVTGRLNVGVVAGTPYTSKYTNIKVTGHVEVEGMAYVGGVGGKNAYADWTDITVDVDETSFVKADSVENGTAYRTYVGGVIGFMGEGGHTLKNITSNINVEGSTCDVGGIAGIAHYQNNFENVSCTAKEIVVNNDHAEVGSIAGVWMNSSVGDVTMINCTVSENTKVYKTVTDGENAVKTEVDALNGNAYSPSQTGDASGKLLMATEKVNSDGSVSVNITKVDAAGTTYDASAEASKILNVDASQISSTDGVYTSAVTYKAKIGSVYYESFEAALDAAKNGDEITLLSNIGDAEYTIDKNITIRGNVTLDNVDIKVNASLALYGLKFTGTSDILTAGTATALTLENCTADVDPGKYSGRGAFITIGQSEPSNQALKLVLKNNVINSAQSSNDLYSAAVFGWAYLGHVEMTGNTFGSEDNPYTFIAVKTMNAVDGAVFNIADNTIYGTDQHFTFAAFDLHQNNSRENEYTAVFNNNSVVNTNTASSANGFYFSVVEVNVYGGVGGNASVQVMDNNTVNGEKVTAADVYIDDKKAIDYVGTDVKLDSYGNIVGGNFTVEDSAAFREDLAVGMAPQVNDDGSVTPVAFDATKFYVSDTYSGNPGDKVGEGLYFDYNAFASLKDAADKAVDGVEIELLSNGKAAANFDGGGTVTLTGTADLDWSGANFMVGRGTNAQDTTVIIKDAAIGSTSEQASTGFHVSGAEKDSSSKANGTLIIDNSAVVTDYLINKNVVNVIGDGDYNDSEIDLTVKRGFGVAGRPSGETSSGTAHTAEMNITNGAYVKIGNENGMGIGHYDADEGKGVDGKGILNITDSKFESGYLNIRTYGTVNVTNGELVLSGNLNNCGALTITDSKVNIGGIWSNAAGAAEVQVSGSTLKVNKLDNDVAMFLSGENTIQIEDATASGFAVRANDGVVLNNSYIKADNNSTLRLLGSATINGGFAGAYLQGHSGGVGGTVTIDGLVDMSYGVEFSNNYTLNGGKIKLSGGNADGDVWGCVFQNATFTINTDIEVNGGTSAAPIHFTNATATINSTITHHYSGGEVIYIGGDNGSTVTLGETGCINGTVFIYSPSKFTVAGGTVNAGTVNNSGTFDVSGESELHIGTLTGNAAQLLDGAVLTGSTVGGNIDIVGASATLKGEGSFGKVVIQGNADEVRKLTIAENAVINASHLDTGLGLQTGAVTNNTADRKANGIVEIKGEMNVDNGGVGGAVYLRPYSELLVTGTLTVNGELHNRGSLYIDGGKVELTGFAHHKLLGYAASGDRLVITNSGVLDIAAQERVELGYTSHPNANSNVQPQYATGMYAEISNGGKFTAVSEYFRNNCALTVTGAGSEFIITDGDLNFIQADGSWNKGTITVADGALFDISGMDKELVNSGTITVDADSLFKAGVLTNNGSIIIDASGFTGGVKKVIDLNGTAALDVAGVTFTNVADGVNTVFGTDGDVTLVKADQSTVYVNSVYTSQEAVDNALGGAANGMYFGGNAFNSIAEAVKNTSDKNPLNITFTGSETVASTGIAYISNEKSTFDIDGRTTTISGINNTAESLWVDLNEDMDSTAAETLLTIENAKLNVTKLKADNNAVLNINNSELDFEDGFNNNIYSKNSGEIHVANSVLNNLIQVSAFGKLIEIKNSEVNSGTATNVHGGTMSVSGSQYKFRTIGVRNGGVLNVTDSVLQSKDMLTSNETQNQSAVTEVSNNSQIIIAVENGGTLNLKDSEVALNKVQYWDKENGKYVDTHTEKITVAENGVVNMEDSSLTVDKVINSGTFKVFGDSKLTIGSLTGSEIELLSGATLTGSTVGGDLYVRGTVSFKGDNVFNQIYDLGTYDGNSHWTVEEGASVWLTGTIAGTNRYGLGYGDKVTINGLLADADAARVQLANGEEVFCSFRSDRGLIGSNNSGFNDLNSFVVNDAYVDFAKGDQSFGTKGGRGSSGSYGNYEFIFNNAVVDANRFTFYDTDAKTVLNATNSNILLGSQLMTKDADSVFTFTNSTVTVKNPNNGNDEDNVNGGTLNLINSKLIYANAGTETQYINNGALNVKSGALMDVSNLELVNAGTITVDALSSITATSLTNSGTVNVSGAEAVVSAGSIDTFGDITLTNGAELNVAGNLNLSKEGLNISGTHVAGTIITVSADSKLTAQSITFNVSNTSNGETVTYKSNMKAHINISIDADMVSGFDQAVYKIIDVLGNDALDMSRVLVNNKSSLAGIIKTKDATFGDYMIVDMGNDVFLVKASNNNTVSVNSAWAGTVLGTVMADGSVYGFNAFSNVNEAIGATKKYHNSLSFAKDTAVTVNLLSDTTYECTEAHMMLDFVNASGNDNVTVSFTGVTSEWISAQGFKIGDGVTVKMDDGSYFYVSGYSNSSNSGDKHDGHVYGTLDADYVYLLDTTVSVYDGGQMLANKGEATIQVKGPTTLNVYAGGYVETAILNVWNDAGIVGDALLNIAGGSVYAKWLHGWGGNGSQTINVTDGGELSSENLSVTQGTKLNVAGSALNVTDTLTNSSEINVSGASDISAKISGTGTVNFADGTVLTSEKGLTYTGFITPAGKLTFDDGVYSLGTLYLDGEATREFVFADGSDVTASGVLSVEGSNVATIEAGAKFNTTAGLVLGGNAPVVNVNGSVTNAANAEMPAAYDVNFDTVCFFANTATLNLTNAAVSVGGFYYNELANYDGKPVNYTVNLNNSQLNIKTYFINTGYQITGKGEWNVVNSKLYSARNDLYFDAASTMKLTGSVADFGGITNDGTITVDYQSLFKFNAISGNGSFTIDTTGYTDGFYKVLDYTGTGSMDYSFVSGFGTNDKLVVIDNDLYVSNADQSVIYVDEKYQTNGEIVDGKLVGYNAFSQMVPQTWDDTVNFYDGVEKFVLTAGNTIAYGNLRIAETGNPTITIETVGTGAAVVNRLMVGGGSYPVNAILVAGSTIKAIGYDNSDGHSFTNPGSTFTIAGVAEINAAGSNCWRTYGTTGHTIIAETGKMIFNGGQVYNTGTMTVYGEMQINAEYWDAFAKLAGDETGNYASDFYIIGGSVNVDQRAFSIGGGWGGNWGEPRSGEANFSITDGGKFTSSAVVFRGGTSAVLTIDNSSMTFGNRADGSAWTNTGGGDYVSTYNGTINLTAGTLNLGVIDFVNNGVITMNGGEFTAKSVANSGTITVSGTSKLNIGTLTNSGAFESNGADITVDTVTLNSGMTELYNTDIDVTGNSISVKEGSCFWVYEYSSLNGKNATMTVNDGAVVAVDASSTITLDAINFVGNGCLNIEIYDIYTSEGWKTIYNGGVVKVVDLDMANGIDQNKVFLLQDNNQNASLFFGEDGDIYVTDTEISSDEVYVNSAYTGSGTVTSDGYIIGINAFNTVEAAIASGAAKMTITGGEFGKLSFNGTDVAITDGTINGVVYGGNADGDANVSNNSTLTIAGGKMTKTVYGGNRVHGGTSIANNGIVTVSGDIAVNVSGGSFTELIGGDIVTQAVIFVREGDINMNISGGVFSSRVHGGITVSSVVNKEHMVQTLGDINMNISGGTFNDRVYGGNWAQKYNLSDKLSHTGNISVTVNADEEIVFGEHLVIGSSGISMVHGDVKLTLSGDGSNLKFASNSILLGSSGDSYYVLDGSSKTPVSYVDGRREIVFDAFQGDVAAEIKMFDTMYLTGDSAVSFTDSAINLQEITTWNFESGSMIDSAANGIDLSGDTINLSGTWADGVAFELGSADAFTAWDNVVVNYNGVAVDCELKSENDKLIISKLA